MSSAPAERTPRSEEATSAVDPAVDDPLDRLGQGFHGRDRGQQRLGGRLRELFQALGQDLGAVIPDPPVHRHTGRGDLDPGRA